MTCSLSPSYLMRGRGTFGRIGRNQAAKGLREAKDLAWPVFICSLKAFSLGTGISHIGWMVSALAAGRRDRLTGILAEGLANITTEKTAAGFQVTGSNPMVGLEGRTLLLANLSKALSSNSDLFGSDARPGNIVGERTPTHNLGWR